MSGDSPKHGHESDERLMRDLSDACDENNGFGSLSGLDVADENSPLALWITFVLLTKMEETIGGSDHEKNRTRRVFREMSKVTVLQKEKPLLDAYIVAIFSRHTPIKKVYDFIVQGEKDGHD